MNDNQPLSSSWNDIIQKLASSGVFDSIHAAYEAMMQQVYDSAKGPMSQMLSAYHIKHAFIRCPSCGRDYCISDSQAVATLDLYEHYQQRRGKEYKVQCDQIDSPELAEAIRGIVKDDRPPCQHVFTLHEGVLEYKSQTAVEWFARGPYTVIEAGYCDVKVGQAICPDLQLKFMRVDYVDLQYAQTANGGVAARWYPVGRERNRFVIQTSAENETDLGKPVRVNWQVIGFRDLSEEENKQFAAEHWRGYLISSARHLLYEHDSRMSILESWSAFELFLEQFIEDHWESPHLKDNKEYLGRVAGFSTETTVRLLLHEALGIHFVDSSIWKNWMWAKAFRNQVAHGKSILETKFQKKEIGKEFVDATEIAKFCYRSVVQAIYFIRYWSV